MRMPPACGLRRRQGQLGGWLGGKKQHGRGTSSSGQQVAGRQQEGAAAVRGAQSKLRKGGGKVRAAAGAGSKAHPDQRVCSLAGAGTQPLRRLPGGGPQERMKDHAHTRRARTRWAMHTLFGRRGGACCDFHDGHIQGG